MSLATVIRIEFAYPGIGILAGDSLQYLSIAAAHGVIMVFFYDYASNLRCIWKFFITNAVRGS